MKFKVLGLMLLVLLLANNLFAQDSMLDKAFDWLEANWGQVSAVYDWDDQRIHVITGVRIVPDVFIDRLDVSLNSNFKDSIYACADYTIKGTEAIELFAQAGIGTDRIENFDELGEARVVTGGGIRW